MWRFLPALGLAAVFACSDANDAPDASAVTDGGTSDGRIPIDGDVPTGDSSLPTPGPTCVPASSTRLRLVRMEGGGASQVTGFFDTELETACVPTNTGTGLRCHPSRAALGTSYYRDAACTDRVLQVGVALDEARGFALEVEVGAECEVVFRYARITGVAAVEPGETIYRRTEEGCAPVAAEASQYLTLGPDLAESAFAELEVVTLAGSRVEVRAQEARDGARYCAGGVSFFDRELDIGCTINTAADGATRCIPAATAGHLATFSDASCTTPIDLALRSTYCGATLLEPSFVARYEAESECGPREYLYELGAELDAPFYTNGFETGCREMPLDPTAVTHRVGREIDPSTFPLVTRQASVPRGRLVEAHDVIEGGPSVPSSLFHDTELDVLCTFYRHAGGSTRCVPVFSPDAPVANAGAFYTDPECTSVVRLASMPGPCHEPPRYATEPTMGGLRVLRIGAAVTTPIYRRLGTCAEAPAGTLYEVGEELAGSELVEGIERVE